MDLLTLEIDTKAMSRSHRSFGSNLNIEEDKSMTQSRESLFCECTPMFALNLKVSCFQDP